MYSFPQEAENLSYQVHDRADHLAVLDIHNRTVTYGMYECWGPGAKTTGQAWALTLNELEAMVFTQLDFINGQEWLPEF